MATHLTQNDPFHDPAFDAWLARTDAEHRQWARDLIDQNPAFVLAGPQDFTDTVFRMAALDPKSEREARKNKGRVQRQVSQCFREVA